MVYEGLTQVTLHQRLQIIHHTHMEVHQRSRCILNAWENVLYQMDQARTTVIRVDEEQILLFDKNFETVL